ncbi:MAG TPA: hypothetical protein VFF40_07555 [Acidimicrobiia bacterium]|nr:hypothetical protein [Acidimicrobiia bacterium]
MNRGSDHAELATLRSQLTELTERVVIVAERYDGTPDSAIASDLFTVERQLVSARRAIERAVRALA